MFPDFPILYIILESNLSNLSADAMIQAFTDTETIDRTVVISLS